ncbi:GILT-like protein C02D5.2 [Harpegnathos saltator]|uniref:GILT-like protein C02D5.2 n=1 Tax=Harpegnathos saltator TaxID=610380 RepID=E2BIJ0_HARSA|nr:GILT-like protein C02D5.2 [Harpegnathos saltator]
MRRFSVHGLCFTPIESFVSTARIDHEESPTAKTRSILPLGTGSRCLENSAPPNFANDRPRSRRGFFDFPGDAEWVKLLCSREDTAVTLTLTYVAKGVILSDMQKTIKTNDGYEYECQHGPIECQANIIHACTIDAIREPSKRLDFLACMIENNINPVEIMNTCAARLNASVEAESIRKCSDTSTGKELLAKYGQMTKSLVPAVSFIPTITLDGSSDNQVKILKNMLKDVCLHFKVVPKECVS